MLFTLPAHRCDPEVWAHVGPTVEKGHGRLETRSLISGSTHWTIENRLHYVRDVSFGEDAGLAAAGSSAWALASVRNTLLYLFRQAGWRLVPAALAHYGISVRRALTLVGLKVTT